MNSRGCAASTKSSSPTPMSLAPDWNEGRDLVTLLERFAGKHWDDPATLMAAYERRNAEVRRRVPPHRLLEWRANEG
jgi:Sulfotransferase domain